MFVDRKKRRGERSMGLHYCGSSLADVASGGEYWALLFSWESSEYRKIFCLLFWGQPHVF